MVIRTASQLEAHITTELKWRKQELSDWKRLAEGCRKHQESGIVRAGVALLYAHWEGFVKEAVRSYLEFIDKQSVELGDLRPEIAAIALRSMLGKGEQSKRSSDHTQLVMAIRENASSKAVIPHLDATVRTRSNLSFSVFEDIMHSIGCDASRHELQRNLIEARLLKARNAICHGREFYVQIQDWIIFHDRVLEIIEDVRKQITNQASTGGFLLEKKSNPPKVVFASE